MPSPALACPRRHFLLACGALAMQPARLQAEAPPEPFFDAHVHLNDLDLQLRLMERFNIPRAVIFWGRRSDNTRILEAARAHPQRLVPFASISPERRDYRPLWMREDPALLDELERTIEAGQGAVRGIGEISAVHFPSSGFPETDFDPAGSTMRGIFDIARRHRLPVMVHVELTRLRELAWLMSAYRDVPTIWAHGGYAPLVIAERMLAEHDNLVFELSARTWPLHPRSPEYTLFNGPQVWPRWLALIERMPQRFIVGTDASHHSLAAEEMKITSVQRFLGQLSPAARPAVARDTLDALLTPR